MESLLHFRSSNLKECQARFLAYFPRLIVLLHLDKKIGGVYFPLNDYLLWKWFLMEHGWYQTSSKRIKEGRVAYSGGGDCRWNKTLVDASSFQREDDAWGTTRRNLDLEGKMGEESKDRQEQKYGESGADGKTRTHTHTFRHKQNCRLFFTKIYTVGREIDKRRETPASDQMKSWRHDQLI